MKRFNNRLQIMTLMLLALAASLSAFNECCSGLDGHITM